MRSASDIERAKAWYASVLQLQPRELTGDGVLTAPDGRKVAWFKDSEGNILSIATM